jgi:hypothetical protein
LCAAGHPPANKNHLLKSENIIKITYNIHNIQQEQTLQFRRCMIEDEKKPKKKLKIERKPTPPTRRIYVIY